MSDRICIFDIYQEINNCKTEVHLFSKQRMEKSYFSLPNQQSLYIQPEEEKLTYFEQILAQLINEMDTRFDDLAQMKTEFLLCIYPNYCVDKIYLEELKVEIRRLKRDNCVIQEAPMEFGKNTISTA